MAQCDLQSSDFHKGGAQQSIPSASQLHSNNREAKKSLSAKKRAAVNSRGYSDETHVASETSQEQPQNRFTMPSTQDFKKHKKVPAPARIPTISRNQKEPPDLLSPNFRNNFFEPDSTMRYQPFSLLDYLKLELAATDSDEAHHYKRERIKNFLLLPDALERALMFGWFVCLDSFLYTFTILPIRFMRSLFNLIWSFVLRARSDLKSSEKVDISKGILILLTCCAVHTLDASRIYHNIRGQAAIKLYVLYNVLEIGDKLCCALGQDVLDCLFSNSTFGSRVDGCRRHLQPLAFMTLALVYNIFHTVLLFYQLVTLNVTVNSFSNALMTLLLSNQFVEIKGSVFKKFEKEGLFQITCADMVERFQLFMMLSIIGLRNTVEMTPSTLLETLATLFGPLAMVLGSEILVDWLKHAFITKFNHIRPTVYARFTDVLCRDYVLSASAPNNNYVDQSPAISRRIGLPVLPLACLTIRSVGQIWIMAISSSEESLLDKIEAGVSSNTMSSKYTDFGGKLNTGASTDWEAALLSGFGQVLAVLLLFVTLVAIKLWFGVILLKFAHKRYQSMKDREEEEKKWEDERKREDLYRGLVEVDKATKAILNNPKDNLRGEAESRSMWTLERYSMVSKRIW